MLVWPNVVVEWLAFLLRIAGVPDSNIGPETCHPHIDFPWFSKVFPGIYRDSILKQATTHNLFLPYFSKSTLIYYPFIQRYTVWATGTVIK
jgi:hypothetical protein